MAVETPINTAENVSDFDRENVKPDEATDGYNIVQEAVKRFQEGYDRDRHNQESELEDLEFESGHQWPEAYRRERQEANRPWLVINQTSQYVKLITGEVRQMRPSMKVVPSDGDADEKIAEILSDQLRYIENQSNARYAYADANQRQVICGIGHWRIVTEYADESTLNQEIKVKCIDAQVLWDGDAVEPTRQDALWCIVYVDMNRDTFARKYPDFANDGDFERSDAANRGRDAAVDLTWNTDDYIRLGEYWKKVPITRTLIVNTAGDIDDVTNDPDKEEKLAMAREAGVQIAERPGFKIMRYLLTSKSVIETTEWPGRYIPIIPCIGEETKIGRKIIRRGIVRNLMDPQRRYNYFVTAEAEIVALQPKAPWLGTETNFSVDNDRWETVNIDNHPYLTYVPDPDNNGIPPQRGIPPMSSQGLTNGIAIASEDMKRVTGKFDASTGAPSSEESGRAIVARQRQGDTTSYVYVDNFSLAVQHSARVVIDLIPHVYDTERMITLLNEEGEYRQETVNRAVPQVDHLGNALMQVENNILVGSYDVVPETGTTYATKKEEAKQGMTEFARAYPPIMEIAGDLIAKGQDWPLADKIVERMRNVMPAKLLGEDAPPQPPQEPPSPSQEAVDAQVEAEADAMKKRNDLEYQQTKAQNDLEYQRAKQAIDLEGERQSTLYTLAREKSRVLADITTRLDKGLPVDAQLDAVEEITQLENQVRAQGSGPPNGSAMPL